MQELIRRIYAKSDRVTSFDVAHGINTVSVKFVRVNHMTIESKTGDETLGALIRNSLIEHHPRSDGVRTSLVVLCIPSSMIDGLEPSTDHNVESNVRTVARLLPVPRSHTLLAPPLRPPSSAPGGVLRRKIRVAAIDER